jgi:hypothetical protein
MYVLEESDCALLPMKLPNKEAKASAEAAEGRARTKENDVQHHTYPTQSGIRLSQGLGGVRRTAQTRKQERFTALLHHLTVDLLRESYYALKRNAAPGVDGVSWQSVIRRQLTYCSKFSCSPCAVAAAFRPGARRAIGRPSRRSSSITKSAVPSGRPILSAFLSEVNASS